MALSFEITGQTFAYAFAMAFLLFLLQILLWKVLKLRNGVVRHEPLWVILLYFGIPLAALFYHGDVPKTALLLSLCTAYVAGLYPPYAVLSPSFMILRLTKSREAFGGMSKDALIEELGKSALLWDRVRDLQKDGLLNDSMKPKRLGFLCGSLFFHYRRLLKLPTESG